MEREFIQELNDRFQGKSLAETFDLLIQLELGHLAFSTSFGQEDQVITDLIFKNNYPIEVFTLDTGRLFEETYEVYNRTV